jgi:hypothetical protein
MVEEEIKNETANLDMEDEQELAEESTAVMEQNNSIDEIAVAVEEEVDLAINKNAFKSIFDANETVRSATSGILKEVQDLFHSNLDKPEYALANAYILNERRITPAVVHTANEIGIVSQIDGVSLAALRDQAVVFINSNASLENNNLKIVIDTIDWLCHTIESLSKYCAGWLAFTYCNANGDPVSIKLRQPFKKDFRQITFMPTGSLGVFPYSLCKQALEAKPDGSNAYFSEGEFNSLAVYSACMNIDKPAIPVVSIGSSKNTDTNTLAQLFIKKQIIFLPDNDEASAHVMGFLPDNWAFIPVDNYKQKA